jgi:hypothetical protein
MARADEPLAPAINPDSFPTCTWTKNASALLVCWHTRGAHSQYLFQDLLLGLRSHPPNLIRVMPAQGSAENSCQAPFAPCPWSFLCHVHHAQRLD